jgi:hypothetical protein
MSSLSVTPGGGVFRPTAALKRHGAATAESSFFISHSWQVNGVEVSTNPDGLAFGKPRTLFDVPVTAWLRNAMTISPDGQRFLITVDESDRSTHLHVVLNWPSRH